MGYSNTRANKILDATFGGTAYSEAAEGYLALTTTAVLPTDTGASIVEPTYTGYARIVMKNTDWAAAAEGSKANGKLMTFAECTAGESGCVGWAYCTTLETKSGLILASGSIPLTIAKAGIIIRFPIGTLVYKLIPG